MTARTSLSLHRLKRTLARVVASLAATAIGAGMLAGSPVAAAPATSADFPTMEEMVTLLPGLAEGHTRLLDDVVDLPRYTVYERGPLWCGYRSVPTRSSTTMYYAEGVDYVDQEPIELTIHDLGTVTRAKKTLRAMRAGFGSCEGRSLQNDGEKVVMRSYDLTGGLPGNHLAYRVQLGYDTLTESYSEVFVRVGDRILHSRMDDAAAPKTFQQQMAGAAMASLLLHTN